LQRLRQDGLRIRDQRAPLKASVGVPAGLPGKRLAYSTYQPSFEAPLLSRPLFPGVLQPLFEEWHVPQQVRAMMASPQMGSLLKLNSKYRKLILKPVKFMPKLYGI
jgi:hypothetical protein